MLPKNGDDSEIFCRSLLLVVAKRRTMVPSGKDRKLKRVSTKSFVALSVYRDFEGKRFRLLLLLLRSHGSKL
jgi:hypothetical protein